MTDDDAKALGLRALSAGFPLGAPGALYRSEGGGDDYYEAWRCFAPKEASVVNTDVGPWYVNGVGDVYSAEEESAPLSVIFDTWPDFRDPATLGVLLAQAREAWGRFTGRAEPVFVRYTLTDGSRPVEWVWADASGPIIPRGSSRIVDRSEAGVLVAALEDAR